MDYQSIQCQDCRLAIVQPDGMTYHSKLPSFCKHGILCTDMSLAWNVLDILSVLHSCAIVAAEDLVNYGEYPLVIQYPNILLSAR